MPAAPVVCPTIEGDGFTIRPPVSGELDVMADKIAADPEASPWWSTDPEKLRWWFAGDRYHVLIVDASGEPVGIVAYEEVDDPDYHSAGIDITLLSCCVNRGVGTAVVRALANWLIDERGHHRLTIDPAASNARAIRAYEKVGFRPIGIARDYERGADGMWHDNLLMDLLASEFDRG